MTKLKVSLCRGAVEHHRCSVVSHRCSIVASRTSFASRIKPSVEICLVKLDCARAVRERGLQCRLPRLLSSFGLLSLRRSERAARQNLAQVDV